MNDNDSISRKAVLTLLNTTSREEITGECYDRLYHAVAFMDAAPREMTAREFMAAQGRLCNSMHYCVQCPLINFNCRGRMTDAKVEEFISFVEAWARENPEGSEDNGNSQLDR